MRISCLIGVFELDPNRVLTLLLDAWESAPASRAFEPLLNDFNTDALVHILGFKFSQQDITPSPALFDVAARLLASGRVALEALLGHLMVDENDLVAALERAKSKLQAAVGSIGVANLTQTAEEREKVKMPVSGMGTDTLKMWVCCYMCCTTWCACKCKPNVPLDNVTFGDVMCFFTPCCNFFMLLIDIVVTTPNAHTVVNDTSQASSKCHVAASSSRTTTGAPSTCSCWPV